MAVLQEDLFVALSRAACSPNLACLSGSCQAGSDTVSVACL